MSSGRKRRVFVGSSKEGRNQALALCNALTDEQTEAVLWTHWFPAGYVTFDGLEKVLSSCSGAIFVATPDDEATINGQPVKVPRSNVMLEFGLLAGRFGLPNTAICRYPGTELPSDLKGLTVIEMELSVSDAARATSAGVPLTPEEALAKWSSGLLSTADAIERTSVVHGYTGAWDFEMTLERWRGIELLPGSYVTGSGTAYLCVDPTGLNVTGIVRGILSILLAGEGGSTRGAFSSQLRFCHEVVRASCDQDGNMGLTTQIFSLHYTVDYGKPPTELGKLDKPPSPWRFEWNLSPGLRTRALEGTIEAHNPGTSKGRIQFTKKV